MSVKLPRISREYIYVPEITVFGDAVDPVTLPVTVAVIPVETLPVDADWKAAEWVDSSTVRFLVGPGTAIVRGVGSYAIWLRVQGAVEEPRRRVDTLVVT